jgi:hypothetical protein
MAELITEDIEELYDKIVEDTSSLLRGRGFDLNSVLVEIIDSGDSTNNPNPNPDPNPKSFRHFLTGYAHLSMSLNDLFFKLGMSDYCGKTCEDNPLGCCEGIKSVLKIYPEIFLKLQQIESRRNGHVDEEVSCQYHSPASGCSLYRFKSPTCLGYLCDSLKTKLAAQNGQTNECGVHFMNELYRVWALRFTEDLAPMDLAQVLASMSSAVKLGEILEREGFRIR